jgi:acetyl esterase
MPLHPSAKQMLDSLATVEQPKLWEQPIDQVRAGEMLFASIGAGDPVACASVSDRKVPGPHGDIPVRVYVPQVSGDGGRALPLVVYVHGGGWVFMSIETHDTTCRRLALQSGAIVVSVEYRLAPEHPFPIPLDDAFAATEWVVAHASELGGDASRVAVMGDSAGGNLSAAIALLARERGGPKLAAQVLVYPALDPAGDTPSYRENASGYLLDEPGMRWFWSQYLQDGDHEKNPLAAPLRAEDLAGLPPATIITAEFDPLRDEGEAYAARLREAGVPATATRYDGMIHGFLGMPAMFDDADAAMATAATALREAFAT